MYNMN